MTIKVTTPKEMEDTTTNVDDVIEIIEKEFVKQPKGYDSYSLIIPMKVSDSVSAKIRKIYMEAGWGVVTFYTPWTGPVRYGYEFEEDQVTTIFLQNKAL